jgi:hypothetical protein
MDFEKNKSRKNKSRAAFFDFQQVPEAHHALCGIYFSCAIKAHDVPTDKQQFQLAGGRRVEFCFELGNFGCRRLRCMD